MIRAILQSSWKILTLIVTDVIVTIVFCLLNSQDSMLWGILDYSNWHPLSIFKSIQELFMVYNLADLSTDDVLILCCLPRCMLALYAVYIGSARRTSQEDLDRLLHPFRDQERSNADACEDELILEEPFCKWFRRFVSRCAFPVELFGISNLVYLVFKAMVRLYHEIHLEDEEDESHDLLEEESNHPIWWISVCLAALITILEIAFIDECCVRVANTAIDSRGQPDNPNANRYVGQSNRFTNAESKGCENVDCSIERVQNEDRNNLRTPLLARDSQHEDTPLTYEPKDILKNSNSEIIESDIGSKANYRAGWDDLISLCKPDLHLIAVAFVFLILAAFTQVLIPQFTGNILDALSEYDNSESSVKDFDDIWQVPGFTSNILRLVVAATFCGLFSGIRGGIFTVVGGRVNARLRMQLLDSLFTQDIGFFDTTKTGDITSRLCNDTTLVGNQVTLNINVFLRSFVQALGVLLFMFMISWQLTLLAFISVPIITVMSKIYGLYMSRLTKLMQKRLADGNTVSESAISSMSTIRAFGAESSELKEYNEFMTRYLNLNLHSAVAYVGYMSTITTLPLMVTALVLFYGGLLVLSENENDHITSGELVSFLLYLTSLSDAFNSMGNIFSSLTQAIGAADKVFELMHRTPQYQRWTQLSQHVGGRRCTTVSCSSLKEGCSPRYCAGEVNLRNIEMYYPARPDRKVLSNLSLEARRGTVVALVGPSGGGKSSVISLIQHLYEQTSGEVTIDDIDVRNLSHEWLSRHIAIVSQEPVLFARSIKRNIIFGLEGTENEPSMEDIVEAARLANAADFIETLPAGYETDVGERGVQLSGGQKQRIAIARALVRKPRILLLDEATSALDAESESSVQQAIDMMLKMGHDGSSQGPSMTVIVVAHRLSTIRSADMIYVLSDGKVVEKGKHEELLSSSAGGAYANLIACQVQAQKSLEQY